MFNNNRREANRQRLVSKPTSRQFSRRDGTSYRGGGSIRYSTPAHVPGGRSAPYHQELDNELDTALLTPSGFPGSPSEETAAKSAIKNGATNGDNSSLLSRKKRLSSKSFEHHSPPRTAVSQNGGGQPPSTPDEEANREQNQPQRDEQSPFDRRRALRQSAPAMNQRRRQRRTFRQDSNASKTAGGGGGGSANNSGNTSQDEGSSRTMMLPSGTGGRIHQSLTSAPSSPITPLFARREMRSHFEPVSRRSMRRRMSLRSRMALLNKYTSTAVEPTPEAEVSETRASTPDKDVSEPTIRHNHSVVEIAKETDFEVNYFHTSITTKK